MALAPEPTGKKGEEAVISGWICACNLMGQIKREMIKKNKKKNKNISL
jgi:hypothetical protein